MTGNKHEKYHNQQSKSNRNTRNHAQGQTQGRGDEKKVPTDCRPILGNAR